MIYFNNAIFPLPPIGWCTLIPTVSPSRSHRKKIRCICLKLIISTWVGLKIYSSTALFTWHRKMVSSYFILLWKKKFFGFQPYLKARQSRPLDTLLNYLPFIVDLAFGGIAFTSMCASFAFMSAACTPPVRVCFRKREHSLKPLPFILANSPLDPKFFPWVVYAKLCNFFFFSPDWSC